MEGFAQRWVEEWKGLSARSVAARDSQHAVIELTNRYRRLSDEERAVVDGVLQDAVVSADETQRFDALALINEFKIVSALPALERLAAQLEASDSPRAPFELNKVRRIVARMSTSETEQ